MPTVAYFCGIGIQMFYNDHAPPLLHARYSRAVALFRLEDGQVIAGDWPPTARRLVQDWMLLRRAELVSNWHRARTHQQLERIPGPDNA